MIRTTEISKEICQDKNLLNKDNINTYEKYIKENPNKRSFIYRDILFISRNEKVYAVKLPYHGILGSRDRYNESQNYMKSQRGYLNYCIHMLAIKFTWTRTIYLHCFLLFTIFNYY